MANTGQYLVTEDDLEHRDNRGCTGDPTRARGRGTTPSWSTGFAERIERAVERRVSEQVELERRRAGSVAGAGPRQLALGIVSLVAFIPISITLGVNGQFLALLVTLAGIVAINVAHAWQSHRPG